MYKVNNYNRKHRGKKIEAKIQKYKKLKLGTETKNMTD